MFAPLRTAVRHAPRFAIRYYVAPSFNALNQSNARPWYAEESELPIVPKIDANSTSSPTEGAGPSRVMKPPPSNAPEYLRSLYTQLQTSPFLDSTYIKLSQPIEKPLPPPLPFSRPKGRRKRGGSDHGPGVGTEPLGKLWDWLLLLQVKEGTEGRGAIEHVAKVARNMILKDYPDVIVPSKRLNRSKGALDGWAMLDLGDHAVHVLSKSARQNWFAEFYADQEHEKTRI